MSFDNSRYTFNPFRNYSSVVMPQGRVQLDADWNEFLAEIARRIQAGTLDTMGRAVYPATTPDAFYISPSSTNTAYVVDIGPGRMYVDGLLAEHHGPPGAAAWDPALAELSGSPQPAPASITGANGTPFTSQWYFPGATAPTKPGSYLFYLDVWTRDVTWLQDPAMIDPAVGIDTSGRLQTVWQVRWMPAGSILCGTLDAQVPYPAASTARLTNGTVPVANSGPCCLTPGSGYSGLENQFYRVQIHQGGPLGTATFKWSRENASVATGVTLIATQSNTQNNQVTMLTVTSLGPDQVLNFSNGNWIELLDDNIELNGQPDPNYPGSNPYTYGSPGILCQIDYVDPTTNSIYLTTQLTNPPTASTTLHTRIRRWDQSGAISSTDAKGNLTHYATLGGSTGDILVPPSSTTLVLEDGLTVSFNAGSDGVFLSGDYWTFSARTDGSYDQLTGAPPRGIQHHYTKLSVVTFDSSGKAANTPDCRTPWASSDEGDCGCCSATVGDNQTTFGTYTSIQQAIDNLGPSGGSVCILPGQYYESIILDGLTNVTVRGCGAQTILYAPSANPGGTADQSGSSPAITTNSGLSAIVTVTNSQHIQLTNLTVEAPDGMACILMDQISSASEQNVEQAKAKDQVAKKKASGAAKKAGAGASQQPPAQTSGKYKVISDPGYWRGSSAGYNTPTFLASASDVALTGLVLTASTCPAIAAIQATLLSIAANRILMKDVASLWPALYLSGSEITIERNWIGLEDNADAANYATAQLINDLTTNFNVATAAPLANGGIQIGGYSAAVSIVNNQIECGAFNGITLGAILRMSGTTPVSGLNGLYLASPVTSTGTTLLLPAADPNGNPLAADGPLQDILIERNSISSMGLCGIGPVGFFNSAAPEIVSIANLVIQGNTIAGTLQAPITPFPASVTGLGYGAVCLPDLQGLIVRDNCITDFGSAPGAQVCGIFLLNGEQVEISRNQIEETRDWASIAVAPAATLGLQAGIGIPMVSPPALNQSATASTWAGSSAQGVSTPGTPPVYQPGLPALRIDQNIVRLPLGCALEVLGYGPFSITGNHFTSGGTVPAPTTPAMVLTVAVVNLGAAIEVDTPTSFTGLWANASSSNPPSAQVIDNSLSNSTSGMVLFTNNLCQLETRASGATGFASVAVFTADHLNFANNLTWMDGAGTVALPNTPNVTITALMDVFLLGGSVNVSGNRFQEVPNSVLFSGITGAITNITTGNLSTFCLFTEPNTAPFGVNANNISIEAALTAKLATGNLCNVISKDLLGGYGLVSAAQVPASPPPEGNTPDPFAIRDTPITSDPVEKIHTAVNQIDTANANRVQQLSIVHQARLTQLNRISTTITAQSGAGSSQAVAAAAAVTASKVTVARIAMLKQQVSAQAPAVSATGWALYGVVYNSSNAPVSGYSLYFVDSTNTYQSAFGIAYTAADGSFQIVYPGPAAGQTAPATTLFVQVCNTTGDPIYTSATAFTPVTGTATYQTITLPAGEKPIGVLPIVFRGVTLPEIQKNIIPAATETDTSTGGNKG